MGTADQNETSQVKKVKCPSCGAPNDLGAAFCTRCGLRVDKPHECPGCNEPIESGDRYCKSCGRMLRPIKVYRSSVRPLAALMLGLIPGLLSIWGIGHFFAGSPRKGVFFLILGILMALVAPLVMVLVVGGLGDLLLLAATGAILWVVAWLVQSVDAYWEAGGE